MGTEARVIEREDGYLVRGSAAPGKKWDWKMLTGDDLSEHRELIGEVEKSYLFSMATYL